MGKWSYIWRYKLQNEFLPDPRPYPPVEAEWGAPWFAEYQEEWRKQYVNYTFDSGFVRDLGGTFIWVTNTPQWDRDFFDRKGWKFPYQWITGPSKTFYRVGEDVISNIVSLPSKENV